MSLLDVLGTLTPLRKFLLSFSRENAFLVILRNNDFSYTKQALLNAQMRPSYVFYYVIYLYYGVVKEVEINLGKIERKRTSFNANLKQKYPCVPEININRETWA